MTIQTLTERYRSGETIFSAGDPADAVYVVEAGQVGVFGGGNGDGRPVAVLAAGEFFGEMAIVDGRPRSATVRALSDCRLITLNRRQIVSRMTAADPALRLLIRVLVDRLRRQVAPDRVGAPALADEIDATDHHRTIDRLKLEAELQIAVDNDQLDLHFQPIVDLTAHQLAGFEALIRWRHSTRGPVRPDLFIGLAEQSSLITAIDRWVLERAAAALARLRAVSTSGLPLFMAVNISARHLADPGLVDFVSETAGRAGIDPSMLKLEVTEGVVVNDWDVVDCLRACQGLGCRISLDDFGTGYSSLSYLSRLPIDVLKIDRSFVGAMLDDHRTMAIVRSIVGLSEGLAIPLVGEGIETARQLAVLTDLGCRFGQGYLFSKALPETQAMVLARGFRMP